MAIKVKHKIERISYLYFYFPETSTSYHKLKLPFFENPKISESKKANLVEYGILSRSSPLYSYIGAKSREFKVQFNITLPAVLDFALKDKYTILPTKLSKETQKQAFFTKLLQLQEKSMEPVKGNASDFHQEFIDFQNVPVPEKEKVERAVNIIMYWINLIRSSVINNADNPSLGPPIIRLNHGILFQDIPCLCTNYSVEIPDETVGYDERTMLPRVLPVVLTLVEHRAGDFGEFDILSEVKRDNIAGWEAILGKTTPEGFAAPMNTLDPISWRY